MRKGALKVFDSTLNEWVKIPTLKGDKGDKGDPGIDADVAGCNTAIENANTATANAVKATQDIKIVKDETQVIADYALEMGDYAKEQATTIDEKISGKADLHNYYPYEGEVKNGYWDANGDFVSDGTFRAAEFDCSQMDSVYMTMGATSIVNRCIFLKDGVIISNTVATKIVNKRWIVPGNADTCRISTESNNIGSLSMSIFMDSENPILYKNNIESRLFDGKLNTVEANGLKGKYTSLSGTLNTPILFDSVLSTGKLCVIANCGINQSAFFVGDSNTYLEFGNVANTGCVFKVCVDGTILSPSYIVNNGSRNRHTPLVFQVDFNKAELKIFNGNNILSEPEVFSVPYADIEFAKLLKGKSITMFKKSNSPINIGWVFNIHPSQQEMSNMVAGNRWEYSSLLINYEFAPMNFEDRLIEFKGSHGGNVVTSVGYNSCISRNSNSGTFWIGCGSVVPNSYFTNKCVWYSTTVKVVTGNFKINYFNRGPSEIEILNLSTLNYVDTSSYLTEGEYLITGITKNCPYNTDGWFLQYSSSIESEIIFSNNKFNVSGCILGISSKDIKETYIDINPNGIIKDSCVRYTYINPPIKSNTNTSIDASFVGQNLVIGQDMYVCVELPRVWKKITP